MTKPLPDQSVFEFQTDYIQNPFYSEENFQECRNRMNQLHDVKAEFGYLRSPGRNGISRRAFINQSPTLKGKQKWAQADLNTGKSLHTSIKVE
nr:hypothetical protein [Cressdnaviricota sp.]